MIELIGKRPFKGLFPPFRAVPLAYNRLNLSCVERTSYEELIADMEEFDEKRRKRAEAKLEEAQTTPVVTEEQSVEGSSEDNTNTAVDEGSSETSDTSDTSATSNDPDTPDNKL